MSRPTNFFDIDVTRVQREAEQLRSQTLRSLFGEFRKRLSSRNA